LDARIAAADTVGAAWAMAHYGAASTAKLAALPLAALRLPDELLETLANLGIRCVGEALDLPREQLCSRFGPLLLLRIDQLQGAAPETIAAVEPATEFAVEQTFEFPVSQSEAIHHAVEQLLVRLGRLLAARNAGALALVCRFDCEGAPSASLEFGLFQPTAKGRHLFEIAELRLEQLRLAAPVVAIEVRVVQHAPLTQRQGMLFEEERTLGNSRLLADLVDRLASRLGREAVVRCRLHRDAQPELAYREEPLVATLAATRSLRSGARTGRDDPGFRVQGSGFGVRALAATRSPRSGARGALDRPLCLLRRPAPLETVSIVPDGPPISFRRAGRRYDVARHWGPERIETGWWRRAAAWRDYYRVETTEGRRFWLFRRRRDGRWFLHGVYE
jgi:protein ImuB